MPHATSPVAPLAAPVTSLAVPPAEPRLALAFHPVGDSRWPAGEILFEGLLSAIREHCPADLGISILLPRWDPDPKWNRSQYAVLPYPEPPRWTSRWFFDRSAWRIAGWELCRRWQLREHGIRVVAFGFAPAPLRVPMIGWISDFQHVHLPHMFSSEERATVDRWFHQIARRSAIVVVMSEFVRADFIRYFPRHASKVRVLRPASAIPDTTRSDLPALVAERYNLPQRFLLLPGQFWAHKNHGAVVSAVGLLQRQGVAVRVVCSGHRADYRNASYSSELARDISARGLESQFVMLGHVPYGDVLQLMRRCICVVAASRFEGYGLVVDEAATLAKPLLISRIPAHLEQDPPGATYFDPDDHQALAREMKRVWESASPGPDCDAERIACAAAAGRRMRYAMGFLGLVEEASRRRAGVLRGAVARIIGATSGSIRRKART